MLCVRVTVSSAGPPQHGVLERARSSQPVRQSSILGIFACDLWMLGDPAPESGLDRRHLSTYPGRRFESEAIGGTPGSCGRLLAGFV